MPCRPGSVGDWTGKLDSRGRSLGHRELRRFNLWFVNDFLPVFPLPFSGAEVGIRGWAPRL